MTISLSSFLWIMFFLVLFAYLVGEYIGFKRGYKSLKIEVESLDFQQAAKWLLIHEKRRHEQDISGIDRDLSSLEDVEIPKDVLEKAGKVRFEV